ncbi:MAG: hypothetical protein IJ274_07545 [Lachnospiraceae bacterium]|nr:hypothetical protein [Lachnospiraceae bacterium]
MTYEELVIFRENVVAPRMRRIIEETEIPEGLCYLTKLEISFLDGRNCGYESQIKADGLLYQNGKVTEYHYEEMDATVEEFVKAHAGCRFMSDAKFTLYDEMEEMEIQTVMRTSSHLARLYPDLGKLREIPMDLSSFEWVKMKFLYDNGVEDKAVSKTLDEKIAEGREKAGQVDRISGKDLSRE